MCRLFYYFSFLLFFFQGIEGSILLRNSDGSFYLCPSRRDFYTPSTIQLALRLAELGWLFNTIHGFIEHASGQKDLGLVGQSLVTGLREELAEYYRLISVLEDQLKAKKANSDDEGMAMTLHKLSVYTMDPLAKMKVSLFYNKSFIGLVKCPVSFSIAEISSTRTVACIIHFLLEFFGDFYMF